MGRVVIADAAEVTPSGFPTLGGVTTRGSLQSRAVIATPDRPLFLWLHELLPHAEIEWKSPPVGHLAYVWDGEVEVESLSLPTDAALIVEHGARSAIRAGSAGATIAHFHEREGNTRAPKGAGGNVHVLGPDGAYGGRNDPSHMTYTVYADSGCPTCEAWLHRMQSDSRRPRNARHFHSEDEIILMRSGGMLLGRRMLRRSTALAIDADTIYAFEGAPEGISF